MNLGPYELNDIYCGDSAVMLAALPDACIDLTVTSPPYDNLRSYHGFSWDFTAIATQLYRVTKPGGVVVWVVGDATVNGSETGSSFRQALGFMGVGFNLHDTMIWEKENPTPQDPDCNRYTPATEYMIVLSKDKPIVCNYIRERSITAGQKSSTTSQRKANGGTRLDIIPRRSEQVTQETKIISNIWKYPIARGGNGHPAIFPEALARDHILSWSNPGDIVLDPFAGSGTTAKMAKMLQRQFIGFDISQEYVDLAKRRIAAAPVPLPFVMYEPAVKVEQVKLFCD